MIDKEDKQVCVYDTCSQCVCVCVHEGPERGGEREGDLNDGAQCDRMDTSITVHTHTHMQTHTHPHTQTHICTLT